MTSLRSGSPLEIWRRRGPVPVTILQYVLLAALAPSALGGYWGSARIGGVLLVAAAVWNLLPLHPALRRRPPVMAVFVVGLIAISLALVVRDPWFGFYAEADYLLSAVLLPWPWMLPAQVATTVVAATAQTTGVHRMTPLGFAVYLGVIAVNLLVVGGVAWFLHRTAHQNERSGRMVDVLREANGKLEAALAENRGLHKQLLTQAREAGILDERARMAREIHDTLAQGLTGIIMQLQAAEHASEPAEWRAHHDAAIGLARESLSEARRSVDALRPEPLEKASLSEAVAGAAARWSALHGIEVKVMTTGTQRALPSEAEAALLRTAQEALANIAKHAEATRAGVTLSYMDHDVALDVRDDGKGLAGGATGGFGLIAMRQRIEGLAGTLHIESEPGLGTGISACIPAASAEASR
ncbi:MAG TPA: sensor histidine kinase [Trebonia sp.]|nr:sensor histidine kinase [Trebonia sp.]